jgi:hypothetical protein
MGTSFLVNREFEEMTIERPTDRQPAAPRWRASDQQRPKPTVALNVPAATIARSSAALHEVRHSAAIDGAATH